MKQTSFISTTEAQMEYVLSVQRGYIFTRHGNFAHYIFPTYWVEPSVRKELEKEYGKHDCWLFTFRGCTLPSCNDVTKLLVVPVPEGVDAMTLIRKTNWAARFDGEG